MSANENRGELSITLEGIEYAMRPSYEAIEAVEKLTGLGSIDLLKRADAGEMTLSVAAITCTEFLKAQGRATNDATMTRFDAKRVGELIWESEGGLFVCMKRLQAILWNAVTGQYTAKGEAKARPATPTKDTPAAG